MAFAREVLTLCEAVGVAPVLDGSLAVFAYTQNPEIEVHDVDLNCSEADFPRLCQALRARGIHCEMRSWRVLQARRDGLKVEFSATEHWMRGIPDDHDAVNVVGMELRAVRPAVLRELYRRGLAATAPGGADADAAKHRRIAAKLRVLDAIRAD